MKDLTSLPCTPSYTHFIRSKRCSKCSTGFASKFQFTSTQCDLHPLKHDPIHPSCSVCLCSGDVLLCTWGKCKLCRDTFKSHTHFCITWTNKGMHSQAAFFSISKYRPSPPLLLESWLVISLDSSALPHFQPTAIRKMKGCCVLFQYYATDQWNN